MKDDQLRSHLEQLRIYQMLKSQASYRAAIRAAVRALWTDEWDLFNFFDEMVSVIDVGFTQAWNEGMKAAGLNPADITPEEATALEHLKIEERQYIFGFGEDIEAGSKANGGKLGPLFARVDLWVQRYLNVKNQALQSAKNDPVLEWVTNAQESCPSCLKLNGQRRRASVWSRLDCRPQHPGLACMCSAGGVDVCKCELGVVEGGSTRGRLPNWRAC